VHLQQVLIADAARLAREQSALTQLGDSVEQLETAATQQAIERTAQRNALQAMRERALKHFGAIVEEAGEKTARWRLTAAAGLDLAASRALEADVNHSDAKPHVDVVPALQSLPTIVFADNSSDLDATANAQLDNVTWALKRWEAGALTIEGHAGGDYKLAQARANAVADGLRKRGVAIASVGIADKQTTRALVRSEGAAAGRSVMLHLGPPTLSPLTSPP
jgi:outer membrane protein OmpA-like peptidoglycan-associated protein